MKAVFKDRPHAGRELAKMLEEFRGTSALVLAIPAGGVPVAAAIAQELGLPLDVVPVSKVLYPWTTEAGYGAVAFDGSVLLDEAAIEANGVNAQQVEKAVAEARAKVERRLTKLRAGRPSFEFSGKSAILVDDGIAGGSTMRAAIGALRRQGAARVFVAVPTAHRRTFDMIAKLADEAYCANVRAGGRFAVAEAYEEWRDLSDEEIQALLENRVR
jgi:putative phosphoribosyl transferase